MTTSLVAAVGGIRVSTGEQQDKYGPDRQRADIMREAQRAGLNIVQWVEEAVSGADDERSLENTYFQLARATSGLHVVWSHPNRVGRHVEVTVGIARRLHRLGATVHIAGLGSLRDRRNWKEFLRDAVEAESEYTNIVYNLATGKMDKARRNLWPEGRQPYGYALLRDEKGKSTTLAPHPQHAATYRLMVDLTLDQDLGADAIAIELTRREVAPPREGGQRQAPGWNGTHVRRILRNPRYLGHTQYQGPDGDVTTVTYPPLVTPERWQAVQDAIDRRRKVQGPRSPWPALFAGHLECAECGGALVLHVARDRAGRQRWAVYGCRAHNMRRVREARGLPVCGNARRHRVSDLDAEGWAAVVEALSSPEVLAQALATGQPEAPNHAARIDAIDEEMAEVLVLAQKFGLPDAAARRRLDPLREERERLVAEQEAVAPPPITPDTQAMAEAFARHLRGYETLEERRAALRRWGIRLIVSAEGIETLTLTLAEYDRPLPLRAQA